MAVIISSMLWVWRLLLWCSQRILSAGIWCCINGLLGHDVLIQYHVIIFEIRMSRKDSSWTFQPLKVTPCWIKTLWSAYPATQCHMPVSFTRRMAVCFMLFNYTNELLSIIECKNIYFFFSHLSSRCVSINTYNKFIISHTHHIQYNAN